MSTAEILSSLQPRLQALFPDRRWVGVRFVWEEVEGGCRESVLELPAGLNLTAEEIARIEAGGMGGDVLRVRVMPDEKWLEGCQLPPAKAGGLQPGRVVIPEPLLNEGG